jgi:cold shock CspA family protein
MGFVALSTGKDAFLPGRIGGDEDLLAGTTLTVRVADEDRGPVVVEIVDIDRSTAVPPKPKYDPPTRLQRGSVKSWLGRFGFILCDDGTECFYNMRSLEESDVGVEDMVPGRSCEIDIAERERGPLALRIRLI